MSILGQYISKFKVDVNLFQLENYFESHPYRNTLLAFSQTLEAFNIDNTTAQLPKDKTDLLPDKFIAHMGVGKFFSFKYVEKYGSLYKVYDGTLFKKLSLSEFKELWNGVTLVIQEQEKNKYWSWFNYRKVLVIFLIILTLLRIRHVDIYAFIFVIAGLINLCIALYIQKIKNNNNILPHRWFCSKEDKGSSCKNVISSDVSVAGIDFSGLLLLFSITSSAHIAITGSISVLQSWMFCSSIFFVLYSVYLQSKILHSICRLCILTASIIVLQTALLPFISTEPLDYFPFLLIITIGAICYFIISEYSKLLKEKTELKKSLGLVSQIKGNSLVTKLMLEESQKVEFTKEVDTLLYGNTESPNSVTIILSTQCKYCNEAFRKFYSYLLKNESKYKFRIVIHVSEGATVNNILLRNKIINTYNAEPDKKKSLIELDKWYALTRKTEFPNTKVKTVEDIGSPMNNWYYACKINFTPAIIINSTLLPRGYDYVDFAQLFEAES